MKSKVTWIFTLLMACFIQFSFAQQKTITGVVSDATGLPLPGAAVQVEGGQGTQTDFDGKYSLSAAPGQKLIFEFIGYKTQVVTVTAASSVVSVSLQEDATTIEGVVVEGYRSTTKKLSNVAVTTVTAKTIENRPNASFMQTLQGQIPGLNITTGSGQPGSNSTVILRGVGSMSGNIEPLYIIDGVPLNADNFRSLNPNDIESVSVLKDAGATAIYGNRGANGVIVVRTKQGSYDSPLQVKYSSVTGFSTMQKNDYNIMNAKQLLGLEKAANRGYGASLTDAQIAGYNGPDTNWYDHLFRTGISNSQVLSLTNGSKNVSSYTSFGYFEQDGIVEGTDLKRFNFRSNLNGKSDNDRFNYSTSFTGNFSVRNEASNLGEGSVNINPLVAANQGLPYLFPGLYVNGQQTYDLFNSGYNDADGNVIVAPGALGFSPLLLLDRINTGTLRTEELKMIANTQASYKITDDLTIAGTMGVDYTQATSLNVQDPESFNSLLFQDPGEEFLGFQTEGLTREFAFNSNASLTYAKTFAEKHTIEASVFTEYYKAHLKSFGYTQNGLNPKTFEPGNGAGFIGHNPNLNPQFYVPIGRSGKSEAGLFSYFGSVNYDFDNKYGLSGSFRRDASYRFAETNRWGTFWSISGRWNIDQEAFMENSGFDMLKLRASFGSTGNQNILGQSIFSGASRARTLFAAGTGYSNLPAYALGQLGNADLKWETIEQANIGLDFALWNNKFRGNLDVYQKRTLDLYQGMPISGVNGQYNLDGNTGTLRNRGVEANLSYDVLRGQDFSLTLNFNGSYNQNRVFAIPTETGFIDGGLQIDFSGEELFQYYMIKYAGVNPANGNLLFYDINGNLTENPDQEADRRRTGKSPIPSYQGGFGFDAQYKGFFLTTQFTFVADIHRIDYDLEGLQDPTDLGTWNKSTDLLNAWTLDNPVTHIPALGFTNKGADAGSDRYLIDASYLRLRYISLGYDFSKKMLENTFLNKVRAYVQAENLLTWSKWRGWDAESPRGSDVYQYPTPRIISLGLEIEL